MPRTPHVIWFSELTADDVPTVGGKNASLGEMIAHLGPAGIRVPDGFATTSDAYRDLLDTNDLREPIRPHLEELRRDPGSLPKVGRAIRRMIRRAAFPPALTEAITEAYARLCTVAERRDVDVAVRSSATAEDLPEASFAGQQDSFLNVHGEDALLEACQRCYASLFTDRAIEYRDAHGFDHLEVALSIGIQRMVRSDRASAGVMFTIDTETGFPRTVLINASWGLGEAVVGGIVDPDEYVVFKPLLDEEELVPIVSKRRGTKAKKIVYAARGAKPTRTVPTLKREQRSDVLTDDEIVRLARWGVAIERHYGVPMDIEWAKDGDTDQLFIVQARPETVQARREVGALKTYRLEGTPGDKLVTGLAVGDAIATGEALVLDGPDQIDRFTDGAVLVTGMTDPDWVPVMRRAAAIVTDHGGRTSHAAIVSRELGVSAIVGTGDATRVLRSGQEITVSCAEGDEGSVYAGIAGYVAEDVDLEDVPDTRTRVMLNLAEPAAAFRWWRLPADGVGLARMEFVIADHIKAHPMALAHPDRIDDPQVRRRLRELTSGFDDGTDFFVQTLAYGLARIAAAMHPRPVIVRLSDFKTNEYAALIGGRGFEPEEENPMLGWRGASRYYDPGYRDGFELECRAIRKVREEIGLSNVIVMVPFCRTLEEADRVLKALSDHGLVRGQQGLELYVMAEIPSNVLLAEEFAERFDGFSIGSNDLTQLILGVDRDAERLAKLFDERDPAVVRAITQLIRRAHEGGRPVGICGQAPSDDPSFAAFLVEAGIDSISVSPDSFVRVKRHTADAEAQLEAAPDD